MTRHSEDQVQLFRITFSRQLTALMAVDAASEHEAFEKVDFALTDSSFIEHYGLELDHRFWTFDDPVEAHHVLLGPDEEDLLAGGTGTFVIKMEMTGLAYFRVKSSDRESAVQAALKLRESNETRYPISSRFWTCDPLFELVDAREISPSDWDMRT